MPTLPEIQQQIFAGIFDQDQTIIDSLLPSSSLTPSARLNIYRSSVYGLFTTALSEIYPVCKRLLGDRFFDALCDRYIPRYRSTSPNLQDYGEDFPCFLGDFEPVSDLAYLPDVARLEWSWHRAFNGVDQQPLDTQRLEGLSEDEVAHIVFQLPVNATLLQSPYPIDLIWKNNQRQIDDPPLIEIEPGNYYLIVWRHGYEMRIDVLSDAQWRFLTAIQNKQTLLDIGYTQPDCDMSVLLPEIMRNGWLSSFKNPPA